MAQKPLKQLNRPTVLPAVEVWVTPRPEPKLVHTMLGADRAWDNVRAINFGLVAKVQAQGLGILGSEVGEGVQCEEVGD